MSQIAVVTGSSSGVGAACVALLRQRGWTVAGLDIAPAPPGGATDDPLSFRCDVASEKDVEASFRLIGEKLGSIDALICSAGILRLGTLQSMSTADFDAVFSINTRGAWLCARAALPLLKAKATPEAPARIVFISSVAVLRPKTGTGAYAASKAALSQLTRVLAAEVAPDHVLVNALAPGSMDTPMTRNVPGAERRVYRRSGLPPLGRNATPDDVAAAAAMLVGPDSRYITGVTLAVDGGSSAVYVPPE
jgi:NAD(P)-dependent dehydrogenase (short-subunit alcohol dehydrogenase family)